MVAQHSQSTLLFFWGAFVWMWLWPPTHHFWIHGSTANWNESDIRWEISLNLFEVSLRGRGRGRGWERAECCNVLAALAAHSERDLKDLKLSRKNAAEFRSESVERIRPEEVSQVLFEQVEKNDPASFRMERLQCCILFLQVVGQPGGGSFKNEMPIEHKKSVPIGCGQFLGLWRCAGTIFWHLSPLTSHLMSSHLFFSSQLFSAHLISCLLSSFSFSQLLPALLLSSQLIWTLLCSAHLNSGRLRVFWALLTSSQLILIHLSSSLAQNLLQGYKELDFEAFLKANWKEHGERQKQEKMSKNHSRKYTDTPGIHMARIPLKFIWLVQHLQRRSRGYLQIHLDSATSTKRIARIPEEFTCDLQLPINKHEEKHIRIPTGNAITFLHRLFGRPCPSSEARFVFKTCDFEHPLPLKNAFGARNPSKTERSNCENEALAQGFLQKPQV